MSDQQPHNHKAKPTFLKKELVFSLSLSLSSSQIKRKEVSKGNLRLGGDIENKSSQKKRKESEIGKEVAGTHISVDLVVK